MAGGDHRGVRIHAGAGDDREDAAVRVLADLKIVLIDERTGAVAQRSQIVSGFRPSRLVQFRSIDQHEPDVKLSFDDERGSCSTFASVLSPSTLAEDICRYGGIEVPAWLIASAGGSAKPSQSL